MAHTWWHIWGEVGERSNRTLDTGQQKPAFNPGVPEGKIGTETLDAIGNWFNNTAYGKRFKASQERQAALEQTLIDQGGPLSMYYKLKNQPNQLEQQILEGISNLPNLVGQRGVDRRISDPLTYLALSGGIRGTAKGIRNVANNPRAMQGLKNINPLAPASKKVVKVDAFDPSTRIEPMTSSSIRKYEALRKQAATKYKSELEALKVEQGRTSSSVFAYKTEGTGKNIIHRSSGKADKALLKKDVKAWIKQNSSELMRGTKKRGDFGTIFHDNRLHYIVGLGEHLATGGQKNFDIRPAGGNIERKIQSDPANIKVVNEWLDYVNEAFDETNGKFGVSREVLNPQSFRKLSMKGSYYMDKITQSLAKEWNLPLQKGHMAAVLGKEGLGPNVGESQFVQHGTDNIRLSNLNDFTREQFNILNLPGPGSTTKSPTGHEQLGWIQAAVRAAAGEKFKGTELTLSDKIALQRLGKKMNPTDAAYMILAQREVLNRAIEAGLTGPDEMAVLKKHLTEIDVEQQIITAKNKAADRKRDFQYESRTIPHYPKEKFKRLPRAEPKGKKQPKITESMWKALKDWELIDARSNRLWMNR